MSHDGTTLSYIEDPFCHFHSLKDVSLLGRAGTKVKAKANALRMQLMKKQKVDEPTNAGTWTPSTKQREMNGWRDYIQ